MKATDFPAPEQELEFECSPYMTEEEAEAAKQAAVTFTHRDAAYYTVPYVLERVLSTFSEGCFYVEEVNRFFHYDEATVRYSWQSLPQMEALVASLLKAEYEELQVDAATVAEAGKQALALLSPRLVTDTVKALRGRVQVPLSEVNNTRGLVACRNGVRDLEARKLIAFDRTFKETRTTNASFVEDAELHPDARRVLAALPDDAVEWFLEQFGKALSGYYSKSDFIVLLEGQGSAGKTTLVKLLLHIAGTYRTELNVDTFHHSAGSNFKLAGYEGARVALLDDISPKHINATTLKQIVNQDHINIERKGVQNYEVLMEAHTFATCNALPPVAETDEGVWRRLVPVTFSKRFTTNAQEVNGTTVLLADRKYHDSQVSKLPQEVLDSILSVALRLAEEWLARDAEDSPLPASCQARLESWRAGADDIMGFCNEFVVFDPRYSCLSADLFDCFTEWRTANGAGRMGMRSFKTAFDSHSLVASHGVTYSRCRLGESQHSQWHSSFGDKPARPSEGMQSRYMGVRILQEGDDAEVLREEAAAYCKGIRRAQLEGELAELHQQAAEEEAHGASALAQLSDAGAADLDDLPF